VLVVSLLLHALVGVALGRLRVPTGRRASTVEVTIRNAARPRVTEPRPPVERPPEAAVKRAPIASAPRPEPQRPPPLRAADPHASDAQHGSDAHAAEPPPAEPRAKDSPGRVNLFAPSALAEASHIDLAPSAADRAWRPRRGVGGESAAGGVDVGSFLAEDAARLRVQKGAVAPELRGLERRLDAVFAPSFIQADVSNRAELFWKQLRGFWRNPPKTGELARTMDPTKETYADKVRSMRPEQAFFLGRRVEVFVRQKADGTILEMALRNASGYRAFDDVALAAVEKALAGRVPSTAKGAEEVRTLWQLDATAYVVISPEPQLVFDEATGKHEWIYPLQKKVDHHVRLIAVY
jgi:hypothetical protein